MGFDNDCILNIQSLAGEYFCPVCRLLVYPNEALQSQCTHLYCKPCLTYIISTTQACPYDGYLVTEADSKPLADSNQALAETIGKIQVHCLFHRSGCTWQGPLSECTNHCSECAFGNSHVVCNRCSIQILHRQVQEHAQNCPGVQVQVQQAAVTQENAATATAVSSNQTQSTTQAGTATSQSQPSQTTAMPVQDPSQQASSNSQGQTAVQTSLPTHEQWYQQQQYQQYYQQYPGYDPYQQRYQQNYPYQQQAFGQYQQNFQAHTAQVGQQQPFQPYLQAQPQPQGPAGQQFQPQAQPQPQPQGPTQQQLQPHVQPQPQSLLPVPTHMASQTQVQANQLQQPQPAVQAQNQLLPQAHPNTLTQTQPHPQGQPHSALPPVQHPQMPLYQQPYPQMPISQPAAHSLSQQHLLRPQPQPHPQALPQPLPNMQLQTQHPSSHAVTNNQSYPQVQPQIQFPQQMQLAATHQQPMQVHAQGPHQLQCPQPPQTHPLVQSKAPIYQQHQAPVPSHGQASVALLAQMQQIQPHLQQVGHHIQQHPNMGPVVQTTPLVQNQSYGGQLSGQQQQLRQPIQGPLRSQGPSHTFQQTHGYPHPQQTASSHGVQPHQSHYSGARPVTPTHLQSQPYVQSTGVLQGRQVQFGTNGTSGDDKTEAKVLDAGAGTEHDNLKSVKSRADIKSVGDDSKPIGLVEDKSTNANTSAKGIPESELQKEENGNPINKHMVKEEILGSSLEQSDVQKLGEVVADNQKIFAEESGDEKNKFQKVPNGQQDGNLSQMPGYSQMQAKGAAQSANLVLGADRGIHQPSTHREALTLQQRSAASSGLHSPSGRQHILLPGYSSNEHGLQGHGHFPHPRQQPYGPETPSSHQSAPQGPYNQRKVNPPHSQLPGPSYIDNKLPALQHSVSPGQGPFGQPSDIHASMSRNRPLASETLRDQNPLHMDPGQRRFDDDLNRFPRPSHPSHLYTEHVSENWSNFPSSRPFDGVPHGFGDIAPRPPNNEHLGRSPGGGLHPLRLGPSEAGLRPVALINDPTRSLNSSHTHPDFQGHIPGHGRRHMDGRLPRNPPGEYLGISRGGLPGGPGRNIGLEDMDFRELRQFGDPLGNEFNIGRFPLLPSQARRIDFDGRGDSRMDEQFRDHASFGNFPSNPRFRSFPDHPPTPGELLGGNRPNHPKPGEPGFRSSFILQGDMDPFDNSRKKKLVISMGWCRICKVDCETVEGLDLHSQTREHQQMAMDMVRSIKQSVKKRKLPSSDHSSLDDPSRSRNVKSEGCKI